jgi:hypothetical protein
MLEYLCPLRTLKSVFSVGVQAQARRLSTRDPCRAVVVQRRRVREQRRRESNRAFRYPYRRTSTYRDRSRTHFCRLCRLLVEQDASLNTPAALLRSRS